MASGRFDHGRLGIIVVNYRSSDLLRRNLAALDLGATDVRVVVVDNRSTADERRRVTRLARESGWTCVLANDNRGFGAGVNLGVRRALDLGCSSLLLINPDAVLHAAAVRSLWEQVARDPDALVAPRILDSDGGVYFTGAGIDMACGRTFGRSAAACAANTVRPWLTAACLALSADLYERVGGFDDSYFMYWEDVDFSIRASAAGASLVVREDVTVVHDEGGSQLESRQRAKSPLYYRYNCRNRLLFAAKHLDRPTLIRWIVHTPGESWQILLRGGRRQLLTSPHRSLLPALIGTGAGLALAVRALVAGGQGRAPRRKTIARR